MTWGLVAVAGVLMVNALVGENGYLATLQARREYEALSAAVAKVQRENERLAAQAARLKTDPAAIEEEARRELGLVKPGETLIILRDPRPPAATPTSGRQ